MPTGLDAAFFAQAVTIVARELIGAELTVQGTGGVIVETEAYERSDPASHSFRGQTPRNASLFGPVDRAYVYRSHGLHWCLCLVCGPEPGAAVLVRALEPRSGIEQMCARRQTTDERLLCAGPGRLCQALGITSEHNGMSLQEPPFCLVGKPKPVSVVAGPRIGISKATELPWRFGLAGSKYVSRPFVPVDH